MELNLHVQSFGAGNFSILPKRTPTYTQQNNDDEAEHQRQRGIHCVHTVLQLCTRTTNDAMPKSILMWPFPFVSIDLVIR